MHKSLVIKGLRDGLTLYCSQPPEWLHAKTRHNCYYYCGLESQDHGHCPKTTLVVSGTKVNILGAGGTYLLTNLPNTCLVYIINPVHLRFTSALEELALALEDPDE